MSHIHELIDLTIAVYIVHKDEVLLINHKELGMWLPVGGHVELHEDTDQALEREIQEECGLKVKIFGDPHRKLSRNVKPLRLPQFMDIHGINKTHKHMNLIYFAQAQSANAKLAKKEHHGIKWFGADELNDRKFRILPEVKFYATQALRLIGKK
jgi:8-oxo-dGTP pyrophosphatase MutT (NUDIX family)